MYFSWVFHTLLLCSPTTKVYGFAFTTTTTTTTTTKTNNYNPYPSTISSILQRRHPSSSSSSVPGRHSFTKNVATTTESSLFLFGRGSKNNNENNNNNNNNKSNDSSHNDDTTMQQQEEENDDDDDDDDNHQHDNGIDIDIDRESLRLDSFNNYVLISALVSTSSMTSIVFFQPIDDPNMELPFPTNILCLLTQLTAIVLTMTSTLSTVVFALEELYGKSALGLRKDTKYKRFLEETEDVRKLGFQAFSASIVIFSLHAGLLAMERVRGITNKSIAAAVALAGIYFINSSWNTIFQAATVLYEKEDDSDDKEEET